MAIRRFAWLTCALLAATGGLLVLRASSATAQEGAGPTITITGGSVLEGNSGVNGIEFTVTVAGSHPGGVGAQYGTSPVTADERGSGNCVPGSGDYLEQSGSVSFSSSESVRTILIATCGDRLDELDETFQVQLSAPSGGATLGNSSAVGTILDDDDQPDLRINNTNAAEGNAGSTQATVPVSLSTASGRDVTFTFATQTTGSATRGDTCGGSVDYRNTTGTGTIPAGATTPATPVTVPVCGDTRDEPNETFFVRLGSVVNADPPSGDGRVTITDNDATTGRIRVNDVTVSESANPAQARFTVSLTAPAGPTVNFTYATANGTATGGTTCGGAVDYVSRTGTGTFASGVVTANVDVTICNDAVDENNQTFFLNITGQTGAAGIDDGQGQATITDDDAPPTVSVTRSAHRTEGDSGTANLFVLSALSARSEKVITVTFATANANGAAAATAGTCGNPGADYETVNRTVTFTPGSRINNIAIPVCGDTTPERSETLNYAISNVQNATPGNTTSGNATIVNDDGPDVSVVDASVLEGNSGLKNFNLVFQFSGPAPVAGSITYTLGGNAAVRDDFAIPFCDPGVDFNARSPNTVNFAAGATQVTKSIIICGDIDLESNEAIVVTVTRADFAGIGDGSGTVKILTDDIGEGLFALSPEVATVDVGDQLTYQFGWEVPEPLVWRDLTNLRLRLRDHAGTVMRLRWDEADDTLHLGGQDGPSGHLGDHVTLEGRYGRVHLRDSLAQDSGPTGRSVTLTLSLELTGNAAGHTFIVDVGAALDSGDPDAVEFHRAGTLTVRR